MKKNISFFGASVTQQNDGYVEYFKNKNDIIQNYNAKQKSTTHKLKQNFYLKRALTRCTIRMM
jgi:hypothetical protein